MSTVFWSVFTAFLVSLAVHLWVLARVRPFRKDLAEPAGGLGSFIGYLSSSWKDGYSTRNYTDDGKPLVIWVRITGALAMMFLAGFLVDIAAEVVIPGTPGRIR
jgi:hypothetical protein